MKTTIIKFLIKLKNASMSQKETITIPTNCLITQFLKFLYKEGFIQSFSFNFVKKQNQKKSKTTVYLRYCYNKPILLNIKIVSSPAYTQYLKIKSIAKLPTKKRLFVLSTTKGLLSSLECKKHNIGGILLFTC